MASALAFQSIMTSLLAGLVSSTETQGLAIHIARLIFDFGCMGMGAPFGAVRLRVRGAANRATPGAVPKASEANDEKSPKCEGLKDAGGLCSARCQEKEPCTRSLGAMLCA